MTLKFLVHGVTFFTPHIRLDFLTIVCHQRGLAALPAQTKQRPTKTNLVISSTTGFSVKTDKFNKSNSLAPCNLAIILLNSP